MNFSAKKLTLLLFSILVPSSASADINISSSNTGECITGEVVEAITAYGNNNLKFYLKSNRSTSVVREEVEVAPGPLDSFTAILTNRTSTTENISDERFSLYYGSNYVNGHAMFQMLLASMLTGVRITSDYGGSSCESKTLSNMSLHY